MPFVRCSVSSCLGPQDLIRGPEDLFMRSIMYFARDPEAGAEHLKNPDITMCFQVKDVLDSMHKDAGEKGEVKNEKGEFLLRVDGGATVINLLMQLQADLLGSPVVRPSDIETTALGAAYAAGLAVGVWTEEEIFYTKEKAKTEQLFRPTLEEDLRKKKVDSWCKAVSRSFDLADLSL